MYSRFRFYYTFLIYFFLLVNPIAVFNLFVYLFFLLLFLMLEVECAEFYGVYTLTITNSVTTLTTLYHSNSYTPIIMLILKKPDITHHVLAVSINNNSFLNEHTYLVATFD